MQSRRAYPFDVSDEDWALVAPYLTLLPETASQREHSLREVFNGLRYVVRYGVAWRAMPHDLPPWHAVYDQAQRWLNRVGRQLQLLWPVVSLSGAGRPTF
jgi:transposase